MNIVIKNIEEYYELEKRELDYENTTIDICLSDDNHDKITFYPWIKNLYIQNYKYELDNLPDNLYKLVVDDNTNLSLNNLPLNLKQLFLYNCNCKIDNLPENLEYLHISGYEYNHSMDNLPNNLQSLVLYIAILNSKLDYLPPNLKYLKLARGYDYTLDNLPDKLEKLEISIYYNKMFNKLPKSLKEIVISKSSYDDNWNTQNNNIISRSIKNIRDDIIITFK